MHIQFKKDRLRLGPVCLGMLTLISIAMLCPGVSDPSSEARAAEGDTSGSTSTQADGDVPASAGGSSLSVAISNSRINLAADPTVNNGIVKSSLQISAKTTNTTGYSLKINTSSTTAMKSTDSANAATIAALSSNTTLANFPANRWGYYLGDAEGAESDTFKIFSTSAQEMDVTSTSNSTLRNKILTIAAKIDTSLPASVYSGNMVISVVANPPKMGQIQYMQDMTSVICSATPTGYETQLEDKRDGKKYWVRKQADGRCWMVQNLALDITEEGLKTTDTNITSNWTSSSSKPPKATSNGSIYNSSSTDQNARSFSAGANFVSTRPVKDAPSSQAGSYLIYGCGVSTTSTSSSLPSSYSASGCAYYFTDVSAMNPGYVSNITDTNSTTVDTTSKTYDAHYLVGNLYTWYAATAGTGTGSYHSTNSGAYYGTNNTTTQSICPRGWKLPTGGTSGDWAKLLQNYGYSESYNSNGTIDFRSSAYSNPKEMAAKAPFYMVKTGTSENSHTFNGVNFGGGLTGAGYSMSLWMNGGSASFDYAFKLYSNTDAAMVEPVRCINNPSI